MVDTYGIMMEKDNWGDWVQKTDYEALEHENDTLQKRIEELEETIEDLFERLQEYE